VGAVRTVGFRYYNPATGRYISRDPIGYPNGPNNYLYVRNNPISRIDPLGLREKTKDENVAINRMKDFSKKAKGKNEKFRKKAEEEKDKSMKRSYESLAQSTAKLADGIDAAVGEIERGIEDSPESAKDPAGLKTALTAIVDWSKQDPKDNKGNWSWAGDGKNKRYYTPSAPFLKCSTWVAHIIYEALGLHLNLNEKAWRRYPPKAADWDTGAAGWGKLESTHDYTWKSGDMNQSLGDVISNGPHVGIFLAPGAYVSATQSAYYPSQYQPGGGVQIRDAGIGTMADDEGRYSASEFRKR